MKIAKGWFSKPSRESLLKKVKRRNEERIESHVSLSTAFQEKDSKVIKENLDTIARYAERNEINLAFEPSSTNLAAPKMDVSRRVLKETPSYDGIDLNESEPIYYMVPQKAGSEVLPAGLEDKKDVMTAIKSAAARILYEKK